MPEPDAPETPEPPTPAEPETPPDEEEENGEQVPSAEVEPLLSFDDYVLVAPAFQLYTPAVRAAAIAGFKRWVRVKTPRAARHATVQDWDKQCAELMSYSG